MPLVNVLVANIRKVGIEMLRYLPNTISMVVTFYAIFLMFFLGIKVFGDPDTVATNSQYVIVSTVLWLLALMVMQGIGWEITTEATRGTLEQLYMSPMGTWRILLARLIGTVLVNLVIMVVVLLLAMLTAGQWLQFDLLTLAPLFMLLIVGMIGVGFMIAGLALIFKQIEALLQIVQFVFFALVSVPVSLSLALEFAPIVRASSMIRDAMVEGKTLLMFSSLDYGLLLLNALSYFVLGIFVYRLAEIQAMRRGLLGQY
jgi:ABC-2 type transport system permease protein